MLRKVAVAALLLIACAQVFAQRPQLVLQTGHPGGPGTIAFSSDGKRSAATFGHARVVFRGSRHRTRIVLTAAQSHQAALEVSRLGHGLLTCALVEEGLRKRLADVRPRDREIRVAELFDYASERVPHIQRETMCEGARGLKVQQIAFVSDEEKISDP